MIKLLEKKGIDPRQIMKSRWILTWKPTGNPHNPSEVKAKARLVILGFQDPRLGEVRTDSPTLTRVGCNLLLTVLASMHWDVVSSDAKTTFLSGDPL